MSIDVNEQVDAQDEAAEIAAAMAGYNGAARADEAPAEAAVDQAVEPVEFEVPEQSQPEAPPPEASIAEALKELKAQVKAMAATGEPDVVRRMHGEIGEINRTLKQMQAPAKAEAAPAPVDDELTAAFKAAEALEEDFPELAVPLLNAMRALKNKATPQAEPTNIDERVSTVVSKIREQDAIEALMEEHPDFETIRDTKEFSAWEATKTPEFQNKLRNTWNPAVVSKALTEFKESLKTKQKKQDRLASAVVTQSASQQAKPSTLPDEEGSWRGYNKSKKRL